MAFFQFSLPEIHGGGAVSGAGDGIVVFQFSLPEILEGEVCNLPLPLQVLIRLSILSS